MKLLPKQLVGKASIVHKMASKLLKATPFPSVYTKFHGEPSCYNGYLYKIQIFSTYPFCMQNVSQH